MDSNKESENLRITWGELVAACEKAGIKDDDEIDVVHITWGGIEHLICEKDKDFGWQIVLDCDC